MTITSIFTSKNYFVVNRVMKREIVKGEKCHHSKIGWFALWDLKLKIPQMKPFKNNLLITN
jgi:hypothetical protein